MSFINLCIKLNGGLMLNVSHNEHVCSFIDILQANAEVI